MSLDVRNPFRPISQQIREMDMAAEPDAIERWQLDADAIVRVGMRHMFTPAEMLRAEKRLEKKILRGCRQISASPEKPNFTGLGMEFTHENGKRYRVIHLDGEALPWLYVARAGGRFVMTRKATQADIDECLRQNAAAQL